MISRAAIVLFTTLLTVSAATSASAESSQSKTPENLLESAVAQAAVGSCTVATRSLPLNIRRRPSLNSPVIGTVARGATVFLGITDGSEGKSWTRIVSPKEGYVARAYLRNCKTRQ